MEMMIYVLMIIVALMLPYNTVASISLNNSDNYSKSEKKSWYFKIWLIPFIGSFLFIKQNTHHLDEGEEDSSSVLRDAKEESVASLFDDIDY